jgi:hypothetical protein
MRLHTLLSLENQLQQSKGIARFVDIGFHEEEYGPEWASLFPTFKILKKN